MEAEREQVSEDVSKDLSMVKIVDLFTRNGVLVPYRTLHRVCTRSYIPMRTVEPDAPFLTRGCGLIAGLIRVRSSAFTSGRINVAVQVTDVSGT
ncbi:MAG: hypothetical protein ACRDR6_11800 [Pseudonocardiaceae bacterium]